MSKNNIKCLKKEEKLVKIKEKTEFCFKKVHRACAGSGRDRVYITERVELRFTQAKSGQCVKVVFNVVCHPRHFDRKEMGLVFLLKLMLDEK